MKSADTNPLRMASPLTPRASLLGDIISRVDRAIRFRAQVQIGVACGLGLVSIIGLVPAINFATVEFAHSAFMNYVSLMFTDTVTILPLWKDVLLSLASSLPLVGFGAVLLVGISATYSLTLASRNYKSAFAI